MGLKAAISAASAPLGGGLQLACRTTRDAEQTREALFRLVSTLDLQDAVEVQQGPQHTLEIHLQPDVRRQWMPAHDTLGLCQRGPGRSQQPPKQALEQEILLALLDSPAGYRFSSAQALESHLRVRQRIALAARKTALAFNTDAAERPAAFWHYDEDCGFLLNPGVCLIEALIAATQPEATGRLYDFSCYRATEYVILLGIALELKAHHPDLLTEVQQLNEIHAVRSGQFHEVYLVEYGSMAEPLPARYYVPGDRLWFRNPDERSSDVMGYEGSWVIYMGGGLFSNFWERDRPYTLESKAIEIYHWRDGAHTNAQGLWQMDENLVEQHVRQTCANPEAKARVLQRMLRLRDPQGVYAEGGCIDSTREYPRGVSPQHCELVLPVYETT